MKRVAIGLVLPVLLSACVDLEGLDIRTPTDAKDFVWRCARSQVDVYSRALLPTVRNVSGPVSVLHANMGDTEIAALVEQLLKGRGMTLAQFRQSAAAQAELARANIFPVAKLTTGEFATLDGVKHQVKCGPDTFDLNRELCMIDRLRAASHYAFPDAAAGTVYSTFDATMPMFKPAGW